MTADGQLPKMRVYGSTDLRDGRPRGDVHAINEQGEASCGLKQLVPLHEPPRPWSSEPSLRHCPVCVASLATEADLAPEARTTPTNLPH